MTWMPFVCIGFGLIIGLQKLSEGILKLVDGIVDVALMILMVTIGMNIGVNPTVMYNLSEIGLQCVLISLSALGCSVLFTVIAERTVLPLSKLRESIIKQHLSIESEVTLDEKKDEKGSPLLWLMPMGILVGIALGYFFLSQDTSFILKPLLQISLVFLYSGVGVSLGNNKRVFGYIKTMGFRIFYLSLSILIGSLFGGVLSGLLLNIPLHISVVSAGGMSYYSLTGAYMTEVYGIEAGTYGFMVNVMREFFNVLLLPFLIKISDGSAIAGGAAGNMDTMLVPVTKIVGVELGLVALVTGVILTFVVPFLLPILIGLFSII